MFEVESKFRVLDAGKLDGHLKKSGEFIKRSRIKDTYFDTSDARLFVTGIFIRVRNNSRLDFKFNLEDIRSKTKLGKHKVCSEYTYQYPLIEDELVSVNSALNILGMNESPSPDIEAFREANELDQTLEINKTRTEFRSGRLKLCVDQVDQLGQFVEIEATTMVEDEIAGLVQEVEALGKSLNLDPVDTGYNALFWRKMDYSVYKRSPYMMKTDRERDFV